MIPTRPPRLPRGVRPLRPLTADSDCGVWLCQDERLDRLVVLKRLSDAPGRQRGPALLATLQHPTIATIHCVMDGADCSWLVLEFVEGQTLAEGDLVWPAGCVLQVLHGLLGAVQVFLDAGVVHGDIAPGNVVVDPLGNVRLIDFGLAAPLGSAAAGAGTPGFAAPEIADRAALAPTTDLWSVSALGIWMLCNEAPGYTRDATDRRTVVIPGWRPPDALGQALRALLIQALALAPESRPTPGEFTAELDRFLRLYPHDRTQLRGFAQAAS